jgi:hypothetical protein
MKFRPRQILPPIKLKRLIVAHGNKNTMRKPWKCDAGNIATMAFEGFIVLMQG